MSSHPKSSHWRPRALQKSKSLPRVIKNEQLYQPLTEASDTAAADATTRTRTRKSKSTTITKDNHKHRNRNAAAAAQRAPPEETRLPGAASWSSWLLTPPTQLLRRRQTERARVAPISPSTSQRETSRSSSSSPRIFRSTPVLTILLVRLDDHLQAYCDCLQDPSFSNAAAASAVLDSSVATASEASPTSAKSATSTSNTPPPFSPMFSPNSRRNRRSLSPLTNTRKSISVNPSVLALEAEWEKYVSPLLLLAGAEASYVQMEHLLSECNAKNLLSLYNKIADDLLAVKETLCDPFLTMASQIDDVDGDLPDTFTDQASTTNAAVFDTTTTTTDNVADNVKDVPISERSYPTPAHQSAESLSKSIQTLILFAGIRTKLIRWHLDLFRGTNHEYEIGNASSSTASSENRNNNAMPWNQRAKQLANELPNHCETNNSNQHSCGAARSMIESVDQEIKTLTAVISAVYHLERGSFLNTVVNAKILKNHMKDATSTVLQMWFRTALERILSVMSVFLDRTDAFATPLYGFDKRHHNMMGGAGDAGVGIVHDYESTILDFLRRHEHKGGSPLAFSVVLDAAGTGNFHTERGFHKLGRIPVATTTSAVTTTMQATKVTKKNASKQTQRPPHQEWPAIFLRTTLHSAASQRPAITRSPSGGATIASSVMNKLGRGRASQSVLIVNSKRELAMRDTNRTSGDTGALSESNLLRSFSADTSKSPHTRGRKTTTGPNLNVLEYSPDSGPLQWPHAEWTTLVPLIEAEKFNPVVEPLWKAALTPETNIRKVDIDTALLPTAVAVTYRGLPPKELYGPNINTHSMEPLNALALSPPRTPGTSQQPLSQSSSAYSDSTSSIYHIIRLNEFMWIVIIAKLEDEARWHRRRVRGHSDEEIRSFLGGIASELRLKRSLFSLASIQSAKRQSSQLSDDIYCVDLAKFCTGDEWKEQDVDQFLAAVKETFGLRPQSPMRQPLKSRYNRNWHGNRLPKSDSTTESDHLDSAIVFFLGPELQKNFRY